MGYSSGGHRSDGHDSITRQVGAVFLSLSSRVRITVDAEKKIAGGHTITFTNTVTFGPQ